MSMFSTNFVQKVVSQGASIIEGTPMQKALSALTRYRSYLATTSGVADSLLGAFSLSADQMINAIGSDEDLEFGRGLQDFAIVDSDVGQAMIDGIGNAIHNDLTSYDHTAITIVDSDGRCYGFYDQRGEDVIIDGYVVIFSSTYYVSSISEAVLMYDPGADKYLVNNFIRTVDFASAHPARVEPDNLLDYWQSILLILDKGFSSSDGIFELVNKVDANTYSDIASGVSSYCSSLGVEPVGEIFTDTQVIWRTVNSLHPITPGRGSITSIWSVIRDNLESSALNSALLSLSDTVLEHFGDTAAMGATLSELMSSKYVSIRSLANQSSASFRQSGFMGVVYVILNYLKDLVTGNAGNEGFEFTNNSLYTPKVYIAGIIQAVASSASVVLGMVMSSFNVIIGAAITVIGTLISGLLSAVQHASTDTTATINTSSNALFQISPYGIFQGTSKIDGFLYNEEILSVIKQGYGLCCLEIPGGLVVFGPSGWDKDGNLERIGYEVHPYFYGYNINSYTDPLVDILDLLKDSESMMPTYASSAPDEVQFTLYPSKFRQIRQSVRDTLISFWKNTTRSNTEWSNDPNTGHLANYTISHYTNTDEQMRYIICRNILIAALYIASILGDITILNNGSRYVNFNATIPSANILVCHPKYRDNDSDDTSYLCGLFRLNMTSTTWTVDSYSIKLGGGDWDDTVSIPSWLELSHSIIFPAARISDSNPLIDVFNNALYFGDIVTLSSTLEPGVYTPQYDAKSFWKNVVITATVATIAVAASIACYAAIKRVVIKKRAINEAKVAQAYDSFTHDPSEANYATYRSAVKKNNRWATLLGGSKYDLESYWHGSTNTPQTGITSGSTKNPFSVYGLLGLSSGSGSEEETMDSGVVMRDVKAKTTQALTDIAQIKTELENRINEIKLLITGPYIPQ